jgi:hypothetical protein
MTQAQKVIRAKVGLLELAKQLGNVSQACKMMGSSRDSFYRFKEEVGSWRCRRSAARSRSWPTGWIRQSRRRWSNWPSSNRAGGSCGSRMS